MNINQAIQYAKQGKILMLPKWVGYFYWDYGTNELNFRNGNYYMREQQLRDKGVFNRNDWYYII